MGLTARTQCRACGSKLTPDMEHCPVCRVAVGGDVNRRAIVAYLFFLFVMVAGAVFVYIFLGNMFRAAR